MAVVAIIKESPNGDSGDSTDSTDSTDGTEITIDMESQTDHRDHMRPQVTNRNDEENGQGNGEAPKPEDEQLPPYSSGRAGMAPVTRVPTFLQPSIPFRQRLQHFTFAWYTVTMSTSGIALTLALTPHRFPGLNIIGLVILLLDLLFFAFTTLCLVLRFVLHRHCHPFAKAFTHPSEALFIPTFFLSIAAILSNVQVYGEMFFDGHSDADLANLAAFSRAAFWIYLGATFAVSVLQYHLLFTVKPERRLVVSAMTPAWILPIFPVMLAGTVAGTITASQPAPQAFAIVSAGLAAQGLGFLVSCFMYATYLSRLMAFGLPAQRPGMFIAVGPPSFTCAALVAMAADVPRILSSLPASQASVLAGLGDPATLAAGVRLAALNAAVFLWGLSFWFFTSAAAAVAAGMPDRKFHLSWWSFVFPNVGFTVACIRLGQAFDSDGILWMSTVMTICLFLAWVFISVRCVRAVIKREIVWPGHDEDSG